MPDPSQFNTDRTYPGRWAITFSNPPINMFVPTTIVELGALMTDLEANQSVPHGPDRNLTVDETVLPPHLRGGAPAGP